jgi:single-strand DNA-binding protein
MNNTVTLEGNLTQDPEIKFLQGGSATVRLSIACNRRFQKAGEWVEQVSFFTVVAYGRLAENCGNSLTKGDRIIASGRAEQRSWETDDKQKRSVVEIVADTIGASLLFSEVLIQEGAGRTDPASTIRKNFPGATIEEDAF